MTGKSYTTFGLVLLGIALISYSYIPSNILDRSKVIKSFSINDSIDVQLINGNRIGNPQYTILDVDSVSAFIVEGTYTPEITYVDSLHTLFVDFDRVVDTTKIMTKKGARSGLTISYNLQ